MLPSEDVAAYLSQLEEEAGQIEKNINKYYSGLRTRGVQSAGPEITKKLLKIQDQGDRARREALRAHEEWQAKAEELVFEYRSDKSDEFDSLHSTIQSNLVIGDGDTTSKGVDRMKNETLSALDRQVGILLGVKGKVEIEELRARRQISARLSRDEIERAWGLFDDEFIRSSGVVASVAVERELLTMCEESEAVDDYDPSHGIARLSQSLKEAGVIDKTTWNDLRALASIRESCAHAEEPEKHRVRRLISDAEAFVR